MIRPCEPRDLHAIHAIINDAAQAYRGIIPEDRWHDPYMPLAELQQEIAQGVRFWGYEEGGELIGVIGLQHVQDVSLIRHAYVLTEHQRRGVATELLAHLRKLTLRPMLVGTWADAIWAIRFYQKRGFRLVSREEKDRLLRKYWSIPKRQVATSVVLADQWWFDAAQREPQTGYPAGPTSTWSHPTRPSSTSRATAPPVNGLSSSTWKSVCPFTRPISLLPCTCSSNW